MPLEVQKLIYIPWYLTRHASCKKSCFRMQIQGAPSLKDDTRTILFVDQHQNILNSVASFVLPWLLIVTNDINEASRTGMIHPSSNAFLSTSACRLSILWKRQHRISHFAEIRFTVMHSSVGMDAARVEMYERGDMSGVSMS